jgi:hypothetical protein
MNRGGIIYVGHLGVCWNEKKKAGDIGTCHSLGDNLYLRLMVEAHAPMEARKKFSGGGE